jgi:hypothetical protein
MIEWPFCPKCQIRMMLVDIEFGFAGPDCASLNVANATSITRRWDLRLAGVEDERVRGDRWYTGPWLAAHVSSWRHQADQLDRSDGVRRSE